MQYTVKLVFIILSNFILCSCTHQDDLKNTKKNYFDLNNYFNEEIKNLEKNNPTIYKTVTYDSVTEKKLIKIKNWNREFSLFINSDINKTSWDKKYHKDSSKNRLYYKALDSALPTRSIEIKYLNFKPSFIRIHNFSKNYISTKNEILIYYPDSLYIIEKSQKILFRNIQTYKITGKL